MTLPELIAALEKAEVGRLVMDCELWCCLNGKELAEVRSNTALGHPQAVFTDPGSSVLQETRYGGIQPWTTSLDAALTLVPEGWVVLRITWPVPGEDNQLVRVAVQTVDPDVAFSSYQTGRARTAPLAASAALLKARQAQADATQKAAMEHLVDLEKDVSS